MTYDVAFIGAGNMAEAMIRGIRTAAPVTRIITTARTRERLDRLGREWNVAVTTDNRAAVAEAKVVVLAVKPLMMKAVVEELATALPAQAVVVSVAAGLTCAFFEKLISRDVPVVRAMPNTPMRVGLGAVGLARGRHATDHDVTTARRLFEGAALVIEVEEDQIDALTALSGSGPAYCFYFLEHLIAGGIALGLSPDHAAALARQTLLGAATMAASSAETPETLRHKVTSPNGTTQAALEALDRAGVGPALQAAMAAARDRGIEMGKLT